MVHSVCNSGSVTCYTHTFYGEKDERRGLETFILTIPNRDSIRKDVSNKLSSLYCDPTITAHLFAYLVQPSRILRCNTRVWQMWRLCVRKKNFHPQPNINCDTLKRRGPRLTINLDIYVLLWYLPYAKKSKWRSDESRQIKKVPYFAVYYTETQNFGIIMHVWTNWPLSRACDTHNLLLTTIPT